MFRRLTATFLVLWFAALASGGLQYFHELSHQREDAIEDAAAVASGKPVAEHHHDESNCQLCADLHMALMLTHWTPTISFAGMLLAILALAACLPVAQRVPARIDCRGPPLS